MLENSNPRSLIRARAYICSAIADAYQRQRLPLQSIQSLDLDMSSTAAASKSSQLSGSTHDSHDVANPPPLPRGITSESVYSDHNYEMKKRTYLGSEERPWTCLWRNGCGELSTGEQGKVRHCAAASHTDVLRGLRRDSHHHHEHRREVHGDGSAFPPSLGRQGQILPG